MEPKFVSGATENAAGRGRKAAENLHLKMDTVF
jgi:hypothetical protein